MGLNEQQPGVSQMVLVPSVELPLYWNVHKYTFLICFTLFGLENKRTLNAYGHGIQTTLSSKCDH